MKIKSLFQHLGKFLMFEQISIIGCGLIGSSVFRALKKSNKVKKGYYF